MSLLAPFRTPLLSLLFSLAGAGLAWLGYRFNVVIPGVVVVAVWVTTIVSQVIASSLVVRNPNAALKLFELRLLGIAATSSGLAALVIVVGVSFTLSDEQKALTPLSTQEVTASIGAALVAFLGAMAVSEETVDKNIGDLVRSEFRAKFDVVDAAAPADPPRGKIFLGDDDELAKRADRALNSSKDYGWTDWSREIRTKRIQALHNYVTGPGGQASDDRG